MIWLILAMAFVTTSAVAWSLATQPKHLLRARFLGYADAPAVSLEIGDAPVRLPRSWETFLARAGVNWTRGQTLFVLGLHAGGGLFVGALVGAPVLGLVVGVVALWMRLRISQSRRLLKMNEQLPDALMLMGSALKSGFGFQQALQLVAREGAPPLAPEFGRLGQDLSLGLSMEEALVRLQSRLGSTDGEMLAAAISVQRQTGGNLAEILLNLHGTIRDRQQVQGQVRTLTAQGKLSGIVLTGIPIFIACSFWVLNREYLLTLVNDPRGRMMSGVAIALFLMGVVWIRKIITIKF